MDMARRRVDLRLDEELLARLDARREELGQTRTKFIERALEKALQGAVALPQTDGGEPPPRLAEDGPRTSRSVAAAPSRASKPTDLLSQRQAELNKRRK